MQAARVISKMPLNQKWPAKPQKHTQGFHADQSKFSDGKHQSQCHLCHVEGESFYGHTMATWGYIGNAERKDLVKTYKVDTTFDEDDEVEEMT